MPVNIPRIPFQALPQSPVNTPTKKSVMPLNTFITLPIIFVTDFIKLPSPPNIPPKTAAKTGSRDINICFKLSHIAIMSGRKELNCSLNELINSIPLAFTVSQFL